MNRARYPLWFLRYVADHWREHFVRDRERGWNAPRYDGYHSPRAYAS